MIHIKNLKIYGDAPQNFLKDPNVGPRMKQLKNKKIGAGSLIHDTSH